MREGNKKPTNPRGSNSVAETHKRTRYTNIYIVYILYYIYSIYTIYIVYIIVKRKWSSVRLECTRSLSIWREIRIFQRHIGMEVSTET